MSRNAARTEGEYDGAAFIRNGYKHAKETPAISVASVTANTRFIICFPHIRLIGESHQFTSGINTSGDQVGEYIYKVGRAIPGGIAPGGMVIGGIPIGGIPIGGRPPSVVTAAGGVPPT